MSPGMSRAAVNDRRTSAAATISISSSLIRFSPAPYPSLEVNLSHHLPKIQRDAWQLSSAPPPSLRRHEREKKSRRGAAMFRQLRATFLAITVHAELLSATSQGARSAG